jgi:hypothetical protein
MGRKTSWVVAIGAAYFLFYLGGSYSFRYTHSCAHSHQKVVYVETQHASTSRTITVCDRYSGNAKRWSFGDPVRAIPSERFTKWDGMAVGALVLVSAVGTFFERRRRKTLPVMRAAPRT